MRAVPALLLVALAAPVPAQTLDLFRPAANPDPLRAASLPIEPAMAALPAAGAWQITASVSTFNLWEVSGRIAGLRQALHAGRTPVTPAELRAVEALYPTAPLWLLDVEGSRADMVLSRGLTDSLALSVHVPWIDVGSPHGDGVAEWWHRVTGLPNGDRDLFPRDATLVYLRGPHGALERRDLTGSGVGDVSIALAARAGRWAGAEHRFVAEVEAPTGPRDGLRGSGGWDLGLRWFAAWQGPRASVLAGAGYTRLARSGDLLGVRRADLWHVMAGADVRIWRSLSAFYRVAVERSPLAGFAAGDPGDPALFMRFGIARPTARGWWALEMGQDWPGVGTAPDYTVHLSFGRRLGAA